MCQFCVEHGEGKRWYLQAQNYAYDLNSDIARRTFMVDFVKNFPQMRKTAIAGMEVLRFAPDFVRTPIVKSLSENQMKHHFGQPVSLEECGEVLDLVTSITLIPCVCRLNTPGGSDEAVCMLVTHTPPETILNEAFSDYQNGPDVDDFHTVSKEEAMTLLRECEERGLMHSIWTFQTPFTAAICNCNVESGCMAMKMTSKYNLKVMWKGEDIINVDSARCTHCRRCVKVCPFDAIRVESKRVVFDLAKCYGCGICRSACNFNALSLTDRRSIPAFAESW